MAPPAEARPERELRGAAIGGIGLFVGAAASAWYFLSDDPCRNSDRIGYFYLAPLLAGLATVAVLAIRRWWLRALVGIAIAGVVGVALFFASIARWIPHCAN